MFLTHLTQVRGRVFHPQPRTHAVLLRSVSTPRGEFAGSRRLRMHIDCNLEEGIRVYPYFKRTLLVLMQKFRTFLGGKKENVARCRRDNTRTSWQRLDSH